MSLKHDIEMYPEMWSKEIVTAVEDYKNGKRNSKRKLRKFVNREISEHYYNVLVERYAFSHRMNRAKTERERKQKIKEVFCMALSFVVLLGSMATTLGEIVVRGEKGAALVYIVLWFWAIEYAIGSDSKSKQISRLELENKILKERLKNYERSDAYES